MTMARILIIIAVLGFAAYWYKNHNVSSSAAAQKSQNGFISVIMPDGAAANSVVILAPLNCPSDAAQRADALSARLTELGIPNVRSSSFSANIAAPTDEQSAAMKRSISILNGDIPAVFLRGMGKANPTAAEVAAEYRRTR